MDRPFRAITLVCGFIMAESALIGRLIGVWALAISMITTCADSPTFSRTQMYLSLSMVRVLKLMLAALMPIDVSCNHPNNTINSEIEWLCGQQIRPQADSRALTKNKE